MPLAESENIMHMKPSLRPQVGPTVGVALMLLTVAATLGVGVMALIQAARF
jgi:hypothetical protein